MKVKWILIVLIIGSLLWTAFQFISGLITSSTNDTPISSSSSALEVGKSAPDFDLINQDGDVVSLKDYRGKKVLLNFWATWCPPCREEMPDMQSYFEEDLEGEILAVNLTETESNEEDIKSFLREFGITFEVLFDKDTTVGTVYDAYALPTSYFIDSDGVIQHKALGAISYDSIGEQFKKMD